MSTIKRTNVTSRSPGEPDTANGNGIATLASPTDMELMLYFDGELEDPRRAEVSAFLQRDTASRKKLSGLRVASSVVRENALSSDIKFDITASVMSAIEAGVEKQSKQSDEGIEASKTVTRLQPRRSVGSQSKPANDNSRGIFTLAAIAVAAAAAMMIWGKTGSEAPRTADNSAPIATQAALPEPTAAAIPEAAEPVEAELEHGVEVAAVDFGAHMGTIFYVPTGAQTDGATTTVVWVDDESAGGK